MTVEEKLKHLEFKMNLLYEGSEFSRFLYDSDITKEQLDLIYDVLNAIQEKMDHGEDVSSSMYESQVLGIVDNRRLDYHFCESFLKFLWQDRCYEELFPALYSGNIKFKHLFK